MGRSKGAQCELLKGPKLKLLVPKSLDQELAPTLDLDADASKPTLAGSNSDMEDNLSFSSYQPTSPPDTDSETRLVCYIFTFLRHVCGVVDMQWWKNLMLYLIFRWVHVNWNLFILFCFYSSDDSSKDVSVLEERKYLIFHRNLMQLFHTCPLCCGPSKSKLKRPLGGMMVEVSQSCRSKDCGYQRRWRSQPVIGSVAAGNILMSSAILMSGVSIQKFLNALVSMNIATCSYSTFFIHQQR